MSDEDEMRRVVEQMAENARRRAVEAMVPPRVAKVLLDLRDTPAVRQVREFIVGNRSLLVMAGGTGCGKTVAACVALSEFLDVACSTVRRKGRFIKAIDIVRAGTFDGEFWGEMAAAPLLVVDDLGTEPLDEKGWALANIASLIDKRYDACAKTILTTNLNVAKFKDRYCAADGGRMIDRLREAGTFIEFNDESLRVPK